ncbi:MAG: SMC-Scp complex subunit ScpB, partial [Deltaproteobacteria bacterium]|nr:SMC-Scp complex subunit ScpB [Deltaproteobacteria bacterium]
MEREKLRSIIESLLFVSDATLNVDKLSSVIEGVEKKEIQSALRDLQSEYENQERGIRLTEVAGGYQLRTPKENSDWIRSLLRSKAARMSKPTLETL